MKEEEVSVDCILSIKEVRVILVELYKGGIVARQEVSG